MVVARSEEDAVARLLATTGTATRGRARAGVAMQAGGSGGHGSRVRTRARAGTRQGTVLDDRATLAGDVYYASLSL